MRKPVASEKLKVESENAEQSQFTALDAIELLQRELVDDMTMIVSADDVRVTIGGETFEVDMSAHTNTDDQVFAFLNSAAWLAKMRIVAFNE